jgi:hypothetical protein
MPFTLLSQFTALTTAIRNTTLPTRITPTQLANYLDEVAAYVTAFSTTNYPPTTNRLAKKLASGALGDSLQLEDTTTIGAFKRRVDDVELEMLTAGKIVFRKILDFRPADSLDMWTIALQNAGGTIQGNVTVRIIGEVYNYVALGVVERRFSINSGAATIYNNQVSVADPIITPYFGIGTPAINTTTKILTIPIIKQVAAAIATNSVNVEITIEHPSAVAYFTAASISIVLTKSLFGGAKQVNVKSDAELINIEPNGTSKAYNIRRPYPFRTELKYNDAVTVVSGTIHNNSNSAKDTDNILTLTGAAGKTIQFAVIANT